MFKVGYYTVGRTPTAIRVGSILDEQVWGDWRIPKLEHKTCAIQYMYKGTARRREECTVKSCM